MVPQTENEAPADLADFAKLPEEARMLLSYQLLADRWEFSLFPFDTDVAGLATWIKRTSQVEHGLVRYEINEDRWNTMVKYENHILSRENLKKIEHYRKRKSALYPWNW